MDKINDVESDAGRSEITSLIAGNDLGTFTADIFVVFHVEVSGTDFQFDAPAFAGHPMEAIRQSAAGHVPPVHIVFQGGNERDMADIEFTAHGMESEEMTFKTFTGPVTEFRLYEVMTKAHVIGKTVPGIVIGCKVEGDFPAEGYLHTQVRSGRCPIPQIGLDGYLLGLSRSED